MVAEATYLNSCIFFGFEKLLSEARNVNTCSNISLPSEK